MSINACDTKVSMSLSLLLANIIKILSCFFFLFLVMLSNFLIIAVAKEKIKVKMLLLCTCYYNWCSHNVCKEMIDTSPVVPLKAIKILSM